MKRWTAAAAGFGLLAAGVTPLRNLGALEILALPFLGLLAGYAAWFALLVAAGSAVLFAALFQLARDRVRPAGFAAGIALAAVPLSYLACVQVVAFPDDLRRLRMISAFAQSLARTAAVARRGAYPIINNAVALEDNTALAEAAHEFDTASNRAQFQQLGTSGVLETGLGAALRYESDASGTSACIYSPARTIVVRRSDAGCAPVPGYSLAVRAPVPPARSMRIGEVYAGFGFDISVHSRQQAAAGPGYLSLSLRNGGPEGGSIGLEPYATSDQPLVRITVRFQRRSQVPDTVRVPPGWTYGWVPAVAIPQDDSAPSAAGEEAGAATDLVLTPTQGSEGLAPDSTLPGIQLEYLQASRIADLRTAAAEASVFATNAVGETSQSFRLFGSQGL